MPLIIFEGGKLDKDKKKVLVRELTETAAKVTGIGAHSFTIYVHENEHDNIGVGGQLLTEFLDERDQD